MMSWTAQFHHMWGAPMTELAAYLDSFILTQGWSRQDAADRAGISKTAVTNILNDKRRPSKETLAKIAHGWGLDLDYLLQLAGVERSRSTAAEQATAGLTEEQLRFLASLTPAQRRALVEAGRQFQAPDRSS